MSKTIDDVADKHFDEWGNFEDWEGFKQALYELFEAEAEELISSDITELSGTVKAVPLDTIAKLLGATNADQ